MTDFQALRRTGPTPEQHAQFTELHEHARANVEDLVRVHSCNRLNGGDQIVETVLLSKQLSEADAASVDALAGGLAAAIDMLAEQSWGARQ